MNVPHRALADRFWRMLSIQWQREPLATGAHLTGGRFNRVGMKAMYLAADHSTAIAEYYRLRPRPGTLAGYDLRADRIVDLTDADTIDTLNLDPAILACRWRSILSLDGGIPPTWLLVDRLVQFGVDGALVPSFQHSGGTNLVLWRWHDAAIGGEGAAVALVDPGGDLRRA